MIAPPTKACCTFCGVRAVVLHPSFLPQPADLQNRALTVSRIHLLIIDALYLVRPAYSVRCPLMFFRWPLHGPLACSLSRGVLLSITPYPNVWPRSFVHCRRTFIRRTSRCPRYGCTLEIALVIEQETKVVKL